MSPLHLWKIGILMFHQDYIQPEKEPCTLKARRQGIEASQEEIGPSPLGGHQAMCDWPWKWIGPHELCRWNKKRGKGFLTDISYTCRICLLSEPSQSLWLGTLGNVGPLSSWELKRTLRITAVVSSSQNLIIINHFATPEFLLTSWLSEHPPWEQVWTQIHQHRTTFPPQRGTTGHATEGSQGQTCWNSLNFAKKRETSYCFGFTIYTFPESQRLEENIHCSYKTQPTNSLFWSNWFQRPVYFMALHINCEKQEGGVPHHSS
jgi:hypothetical protein